MISDDLFGREVLTVTELTARLERVIEAEFGQIWLTGEISNLRQPSSGHLYLVLKDGEAQVRAVMFRNKQRYLGFNPEDGQEVLVRGRLSVYAARGEYQLTLDYMEPRGEGALRLAFEQLKKRLAEEGLFDPARKRKLPFLPKRVAVVTSPTGAAIRDFVRVAWRRFPNVRISIYPVRVQGSGAAEEIAGAVADLNRWGGYDLIVLTRGGGSLEDLWSFNEEIVARAVAGSAIPIVSAVGHEIDFTIADFASDFRAPTPSAAAELIFRERRELSAYLKGLNGRLAQVIQNRLELFRGRLAHQLTRMGRPDRVLAERRLRLDELSEELLSLARSDLKDKWHRLGRAFAALMPNRPGFRLRAARSQLFDTSGRLVRSARFEHRRNRERLQRSAGRLSDLSPLAVLSRGYALARREPDRAVVSSSGMVSAGDRLNLLLAEGELEVMVHEVIR